MANWSEYYIEIIKIKGHKLFSSYLWAVGIKVERIAARSGKIKITWTQVS